MFSAWAANGVPVAEYTVSQIILANKGFFATSRYLSTGDITKASVLKECYPGSFGEYVGIIGAGMIAEMHAAALQSVDNCKLIGIYDPVIAAAESTFLAEPFSSEARTPELSSATSARLEALNSTGRVIS